MASVIGDIAIQVGADIGPLVRELGKGSAAVSKFGAEAQKGGAGMALATKAGIALGSAVVGAGVALAAMTSAAMDNIDALSKQARIAGVSVATFQAMAQVAEEAGVSSEELSKSIVKMQDSISNAAKGTQAQVDAFAALGLSASNFAGLKTDEQFALLAEKISGIEDPVRRTSVALDIFGKSGAGLTDMMNGYGDAVANAAKFQSDFGLAVSDIDAQNIEAANDAMGRAKTAIAGIGTELAGALAPAFEAVALGLQAMVHDFNDAMDRMINGNQRLYESLSGGPEQFHANAEAAGRYLGALQSLSDNSETTSAALRAFADSMDWAGQYDFAAKFNAIADGMDSARKAFDDGTISADDLRKKLQDSKDAAKALIDEASKIGGVDVSDLTSAIAGLETILSRAAKRARELRTAVTTSGTIEYAGAGASASANVNLQSPLAPNTSPFPRSPPPLLGEGSVDAGGGSGGGGGGTDTTAADLKAMQDRFASESELLQAKYDADLAKLETFRQTKAGTEQEYNDLELQIKADHEQALADIEAKAQSERLDAYSGAFGDLASLMTTGNEKLFRVGQAAAIGKATIEGLQAASSAYMHGMAIGGPVAAEGFRLASLAKTGAMIAGIASASPRGGGSSGGSSGGGSTASSGGGSSASSNDNATYLNFSFKGGLTSSEEMGRFMVAAINQAVDNGAVIRGARIA